MKKGNLIFAGVFSALAIFIMYFAMQLPKARNGVPGPGYWPILISVVMLVAAITVGIKAFTTKDDTPLVLGASDHIRVYIAMGLLIVYLLGMYYIGFGIATFVMLYGFITWFGKYTWFFRALMAFAITAVVYSVFVYVLKVPFRFGILF
ncbi:MAG: tripartite tricarboxylate transporter TctB family protein [Peptostreptococcaceae bacterium]|nr:tripartite tricarboxylate transporter TctB family protein [Peptostreptococcaceae bacterium]